MTLKTETEPDFEADWGEGKEYVDEVDGNKVEHNRSEGASPGEKGDKETTESELADLDE